MGGKLGLFTVLQRGLRAGVRAASSIMGVAKTIGCDLFAVAPDGSSQKLQFERPSVSFGEEGSVSLEQAAWWDLEPSFLETSQSLVRESMTDTAINRCLLRL